MPDPISAEASPDAAASDPRTPGASAGAPPATPRLRPSGAIVRASEIVVWGEAQAALAAAERYVVGVRAWAREALATERARGYAEGRAAGAEDVARLMAETVARAAAHLGALELELPALVHGIVAEILGDLGAEEVITRSVRRAVAASRPEADAILRVSPADVDAVCAALADLANRAALQIEADPALEPGEASLRTALGSVELGIAAQLRALRAGLGAAPVAVEDPSGGARDAA